MNRRDFLIELFNLFDVTDEDIGYNTNIYGNGLSSKIDYAKTYDFISKNYNSLPTVLEINAIVRNNNFYEDAKDPALAYIEKIKKEPRIKIEDFPTELKTKILAFCNKYGAKTRLRGEL